MVQACPERGRGKPAVRRTRGGADQAAARRVRRDRQDARAARQRQPRRPLPAGRVTRRRHRSPGHGPGFEAQRLSRRAGRTPGPDQRAGAGSHQASGRAADRSRERYLPRRAGPGRSPAIAGGPDRDRNGSQRGACHACACRVRRPPGGHRRHDLRRSRHLPGLAAATGRGRGPAGRRARGHAGEPGGCPWRDV